MTAIADQKAVLRKDTLARRNAVSLDDRKHAADAISERVIDLDMVKAASVIGGYWPIRSEVDPRGLIDRLRDRGQTIALPVVLDKTTIDFRLWQSDDDLVDAGFGTFAPGDNSETLFPDVLLVPMVGFDHRGIRLGYGGGFYDRYTERLTNMGRKPRLVGIAHSSQTIDHVPNEVHDIALDCIVTEQAVIVPGQEKLS